MTEDYIGLRENLKKMIDIVYAGTSKALAVADQLTFLWSVFLLADDSPRSLNYPFKRRLSFTMAELLDEKHDTYDIIQQKILPEMLKRHRGYVPKRMAGGGEKLTITPTQCYELMKILRATYSMLDVMKLSNRHLHLDIMLYDYMLEMIFEGSIEGYLEWMSGEEVDFIVSLANFHLMRSGSNGDAINVHDVHCRSGQLLTASYKELSINTRNSGFSGRSLSPIMTRIATFRLLLSGIKRFSVLNRDPLVFPHASFNSFDSRRTGNRLEKFDVVYVHPPKSRIKNSRQRPDSRLLGLSGTARIDFAYLLYGLSRCALGGLMVAILPEELIEAESNWILDQIQHEAQILNLIHLPIEQKRSSRGKKSSLIVFRNEPLQARQNLGDIRQFQLSGYEDWQTTLFWDDYKVVRNGGVAAISDLTSFVEVSRPDQNQLKLDELLFESISRLEDEMVNPRDSRPDGEKLQDWQVTLYRYGTNFDIGQSLQRLICDNRVEAVVSEAGEVVFKLKRTNKRDGFEPTKLDEILSLEQFQLFLIICDSESPIPIHKARRKLSQEEQSRFTIQQAVDTVHMIGRMGFLECIYESVDTGLASTAAIDAIDLWMKVPEGERLWKFTASR